jgi:hypothetical protein
MEIFNHVPTHDTGITFRQPTHDAATCDETSPVAQRIMTAIKQLAARLEPLEKKYGITLQRVPSKGPGISPRALNPQQAYAAAMTAYQMSQAKINQRKAHEAMPNVVPQDPDDVREDVEEQRQQPDDPHFHPTSDFNAAGYARALQNHKAARGIARNQRY